MKMILFIVQFFVFLMIQLNIQNVVLELYIISSPPLKIQFM